MFQVTRRADYALRIMLDLGTWYENQPLPTSKVAERTGVPKAFMRKIVAELSKTGLLQTQKGPNGGLLLERPSDEINMLEILEAVEGPIHLNFCLIHEDNCPRHATCPGHEFWKDLQDVVITKMTNETLAKMVARGREKTDKRNITLDTLENSLP
jgi:Rrf2 family protein